MNLIKNCLGRVFAFWAMLVFVVTMLLVLIPTFFTNLFAEPRRSIVMQKIFQVWMKVWFVLIGVRRIIKGKEHFKRGQNFIVVCNHNSFMDVPLSSPAIPQANKTIAKVEMSRIPLFGIVYKRGSVLVDRKNEQSRKNSYLKMKEVLAMGMHMCIYPEGTRNKTGEPLQRFHDGAFRLAVDTKKAILPAVIFYTAKVLPLHKTFYFWPHKVEMHFLPPVDPGESVETLKNKTFEIMKDYYTAHNH
jgi:1-acyl-sn-glycerol-3-phosphate acyltransferase